MGLRESVSLEDAQKQIRVLQAKLDEALAVRSSPSVRSSASNGHLFIAETAAVRSSSDDPSSVIGGYTVAARVRQDDVIDTVPADDAATAAGLVGSLRTQLAHAWKHNEDLLDLLRLHNIAIADQNNNVVAAAAARRGPWGRFRQRCAPVPRRRGGGRRYLAGCHLWI